MQCFPQEAPNPWRLVVACLPVVLAIIPLILIPLMPPISTNDAILMSMYALFAFIVINSAFVNLMPRREYEVLDADYTLRVRVLAFIMWSGFRTIVSFDSIPCGQGYAVCRPEHDVYVTILTEAFAFLALVITIFLYQDLKRDIIGASRREWFYSELQLAVFALSFIAMLLQLLFMPPISPVIYTLNFILLVYTVYIIVDITRRFGAANEASLSLFFAAIVPTIALVNQFVPDKPWYTVLLFGGVSLVAAAGAWVMGIMGFRELVELAHADDALSSIYKHGRLAPAPRGTNPRNILGQFEPRIDVGAAVQKQMREAKNALYLCVMAAFVLFTAICVLSFVLPPSTTYDFVLELVVSAGLSLLIKYFAYNQAMEWVVVPLLGWALALALILALVDLPHHEGVTWSVVELLVSTVALLGVFLLRFNVASMHLSPRAKGLVSALFVVLFVLGVLFVVVHSPRPRFNFTLVVAVLCGFALILLIARWAGKRPGTPPGQRPKTAAPGANLGGIKKSPLDSMTADELHAMMMLQFNR